MENNKFILDSLKANLNSLDSATTWIFVTLLIVVLASFGSDEKLEFASFKIDRKYAGPIIYGMLVGLNFQVLKLLHNVNSILIEIKSGFGAETFELARIMLNKHPWIFNPFSEFESITSLIFDNLGYALLIVIWWMGNAIAYKLMFKQGRKIKLVGTGLAGLYLVFGLSSMAMIQAISEKVTYSSLKLITPFVGIVIGAVLFSALLYPLRKEIKSKKAVN
ncbi:hypothetical protein [Seonamhaeicola marinus]|uniref:Uncharacterized protein n=1 Tax=Seonamhaeicola marinus TaxID=1912246 RepID=A0A5D0H3Z4_9FLAO|nr:hypothetical protein [Seonamhaeicola marinus]TYA66008.1 hypothetical protein FUA24_24315 [Seonamhaeicola marinus]